MFHGSAYATYSTGNWVGDLYLFPRPGYCLAIKHNQRMHHTSNRFADFWFHHPLAFVSRWGFYGAMLGFVASFATTLVYSIILFVVSRIEPSSAEVLLPSAISIAYLLSYVPFGLLLGSILGSVTALVEKPWWDGCNDCDVMTDEEMAEFVAEDESENESVEA